MVQGFYKGFITQAWLIDSLATGDLAQSLALLPSQREVGGGGKGLHLCCILTYNLDREVVGKEL